MNASSLTMHDADQSSLGLPCAQDTKPETQMHEWITRAIAALGLLVMIPLALAQYPTKPFTIIVPFPAATASDLVPIS